MIFNEPTTVGNEQIVVINKRRHRETFLLFLCLCKDALKPSFFLDSPRLHRIWGCHFFAPFLTCQAWQQQLCFPLHISWLTTHDHPILSSCPWKHIKHLPSALVPQGRWTPYQCLVVNLLSDEFVLTERVASLSCDGVNGAFLHLLLDGTEEREKRLSCTLLQEDLEKEQSLEWAAWWLFQIEGTHFKQSLAQRRSPWVLIKIRRVFKTSALSFVVCLQDAPTLCAAYTLPARKIYLHLSCFEKKLWLY